MRDAAAPYLIKKKKRREVSKMLNGKKWAISLFLIMMLAASSAMAAGFPTKTVVLICPYGAGGSTDLFARIVAKHASKYLGKPIVVVNRTGGGELSA